MIHVSIALVFPKLLSGDICLRVSGEIRAGAANRTFHLSSIEQCGRTCNDDNEQNPDENPSPLHGQPSFRTPWYTSSRDSDVICNGSLPEQNCLHRRGWSEPANGDFRQLTNREKPGIRSPATMWSKSPLQATSPCWWYIGGAREVETPLLSIGRDGEMKNALILLALLLALSATMRADCWPATCPNGTHSKCVEQCDPNYLNCTVKVCKCHCEKDKDPQAAH